MAPCRWKKVFETRDFPLPFGGLRVRDGTGRWTLVAATRQISPESSPNASSACRTSLVAVHLHLAPPNCVSLICRESRLGAPQTATEMLSASITSMLDRVRTEFGVQADVLDANLVSALGPDRQGATGVGGRAEVKAAAQAALREGRAGDVRTEGRHFRLMPLRRNRTPAALLITESDTAAVPGALSGPLLEGVVELLRSAIDAELACRDEVHAERQQNRVLRGTLRFLRYVLLAGTEAEVAEAVIHAAAVWFDVDPRVYRREANGDYVLFASLPAAEVSTGSERLSRLVFAPDSAVVRLSSLNELRNLGPGREGLLVPAWGGHAVDWLLVVFGSVPAEAELTLSIVGRIVGAQMERLAMRRSADLRARFEETILRPDRATELTALEAMRQLLRMTSAGAAALWVQSEGGTRRIALVGGGIEDPGDELRDAHMASASRQVRTLRLGDGAAARLELVAAPDCPMTGEVDAIVEACASVLRVWLGGAGVSANHRAFSEEPLSGFVRRIEEEMARARRFDRHLALLLVQAPPGGRNGHLQDLIGLLRRELRGSDLLGTLGHGRIVALLVETDAQGLGSVVRRVRARLGQAVSTRALPAMAIGEAAFSEECTTVDALLTRAQFNAQVVSDPV